MCKREKEACIYFSYWELYVLLSFVGEGDSVVEGNERIADGVYIVK